MEPLKATEEVSFSPSIPESSVIADTEGASFQYPTNTVFLNVYDITEMNNWLATFGIGAHHAAIQVYNKEYAYGGGPSGSGIMRNPVGHCPPHILRERLALGITALSPEEVEQNLGMMETNPRWMAPMYSLLSHNCIHFVEAVLNVLKPVHPSSENALSSSCAQHYYTPSSVCSVLTSDDSAPFCMLPAYISRLQRLALTYLPTTVIDYLDVPCSIGAVNPQTVVISPV